MTDDVVARLAQSPEVRRHLAAPRTGVYIARPDGVIVWASPSMQDVAGRGPAELVGNNSWILFAPQEDLPTLVRFRAALASQDGIFWIRFRMPQGEPKWMRMDVWVREDHLLIAAKPEANPAEHTFHFVPRPRPKAAL